MVHVRTVGINIQLLRKESSVSSEGLNARDVAAQNQVVNVVGAFVSFH